MVPTNTMHTVRNPTAIQNNVHLVFVGGFLIGFMATTRTGWLEGIWDDTEAGTGEEDDLCS